MNPNSDIRFGKYSVVQKIGTGGMAEVFKCRLTGIGGFDKTLVVKRIKPELLGEPEFIKMFLDEARVAAYLNHPNIVQVFEVDQFEGFPYIAMEYVRGPTLFALQRRAKAAQRLDQGHVAQILSGICEGLYHAHCACDTEGQPLHIVHRDVSPHNIIVSYEGISKLLDFGVARARGRQTETDAGTLKGKLRYMAPEQLRGGLVDERADVFSVGVCLFEAATGEPPYLTKTDAEVIHDVFNGLSALPDRFPDGFPAQLEQIIRWAAEPALERRCPTCFDLHAALEDFLAGGPFASSQKDVAAWLAELFVDPAGESMPGLYGLTPASRFGGRSHGSLSRRSSGSGSLPGAAVRPSIAPGADPQARTAADAPAAGAATGAPPAPSARSAPAGAPPPPSPAAVPAAQASAQPNSDAPAPAPQGPETQILAIRATEVRTPPRAKTPAAPPEDAPEDAQALVAFSSTRRKRALVGIGVGVAAVAALLIVGIRSGRGGAPHVPEDLAPAALSTAPGAASADDAAARAYLEEVERLATERRFAPALDLLGKARSLSISDAELNLRLSKLSDALERDALLAAKKQLANGEARQAAELVKRVLDRDPENAEASRIVASARAAQDAAAAKARPVAATAAHLKPEPKARDGKLSVASEPPGLVYLDDDFIGRSPILARAVREGHHSLQVRLEGYQLLQRAVEIAPDKESVVEVELDPAPGPRLASADPPALGSDAPASPPARAEPTAPRAEEEPALKAAEPVAPRGATERPAPPVARRVSRLPARYSVGSTKDLVHALQVIENLAITDGAPAEVARDVTYPLAQELSKRIGPSEPAQLYPRAVYAFILDAAAKGAVRSELAAQLRSAQLSGQLAANADR